MHLLFDNWTADPTLLAIAAVSLLHLVGHSRQVALARKRGRTIVALRQQAALFQAGLVVLALAIASPVNAAANRYLVAHMVQHIFLMFFAPPLVVLGAPWLALVAGLPPSIRRAFTSAYRATHRHRLLRRLRDVLAYPVTAILGFNVAMVFWHLPGPYDYSVQHRLVQILVEHYSLFLLGVAFWLQLIASRPFSPMLPPLRRAWALVGTNVVMVVLAMTLALFSGHAYPVYTHVGGRVLSQLADQQIGGATLWVCGDLTIAPSLYVFIARWLRESEKAEDDTIERIRAARARAAGAGR